MRKIKVSTQPQNPFNPESTESLRAAKRLIEGTRFVFSLDDMPDPIASIRIGSHLLYAWEVCFNLIAMGKVAPDTGDLVWAACAPKVADTWERQAAFQLAALLFDLDVETRML